MTELTVSKADLLQAVEKAKNYDYQALCDRWPSMTPAEIITECGEVLRIYDMLREAPVSLAMDGFSDDFMGAMVFLESFCMRYLVDIFFNVHL